MFIPLSSGGEVKLIGIAVVLGCYLIYWIIRAIVHSAQNRKYERKNQQKQYLEQQQQQQPYRQQPSYGQQQPYRQQPNYGQQQPYRQQPSYGQQQPYRQQPSYGQQPWRQASPQQSAYPLPRILQQQGYVLPPSAQAFTNGIPPFYRPDSSEVPGMIWFISVMAILGGLLGLLGTLAFVHEAIGYYSIHIPTMLGAVLVFGVSVLLFFTAVGLVRLKKWAGIVATVILVLLCAASLVASIVLLIQGEPTGALVMFLPLCIPALLLWAVQANKKYLFL